MNKTCVQFGAGGLHLPEPWVNLDGPAECDITKLPLPYADNSVDVVFSEMQIEHVTPREAWSFLDDLYRILKPGGLIRIVIPDFSLTWRLKDADYFRVNGGVTGATNWKEHCQSIIFGHSHQGLWNSELLRDVLSAVGFRNTKIQRAGESDYPELRDVEQHHRSVGKACAMSESGCVEAIK